MGTPGDPVAVSTSCPQSRSFGTWINIRGNRYALFRNPYPREHCNLKLGDPESRKPRLLCDKMTFHQNIRSRARNTAGYNHAQRASGRYGRGPEARGTSVQLGQPCTPLLYGW